MSQPAIRVQNLSKRYRIGLKEETYDTFAGMLSDYARRPAHNLRRLRRLTRFDDPSSVEDDTIWALKDVSFEVLPGEVVGVIGRNGAGKSTLLKILSRITHPTSGRVELHGRVSSLLEVGTGFHPELTGRENVYLNGTILGMRKAEIDRKFDEIVDFSGVEKFIDTPVKRYSSGMKVRLAFSVAAHLEPEILLVDEVLAVGDIEFQNKCLGKMDRVAKSGRTVLFVSHNMAAIMKLCSRGMVLDGGLDVFQGDVGGAVSQYETIMLGAMQNGGSRPPSIIYQGSAMGDAGDFAILRLELIDQDGTPKDMVRTWDYVRFRITYSARRRIPVASLELRISLRSGLTVMNLSTQPDSSVAMTIEPGTHTVDCEFQSLPLAADDYLISVALAIPNVEWLTKQENQALLTVEPADVFHSGMPPRGSRAVIAVPHTWILEPVAARSYQDQVRG